MAGEKKRYTLGRGEIYFAQFRQDTLIARGGLYMGNTPAFTLSYTEEKLDHYSSDGGIRKKDDSITLQQDYSGSLTTDNIDADNLAYFFLGDRKLITSVSTPVAAENITQVEKGRWYQLGKSLTNPSGVKGVSAFSLKPTANGTAYIAGTDYLVDLDNARFFIQPAGAIANATDVTAAYTINALQREQVIASGKVISGELTYIAKNPTGANGSQTSFYMPQVNMSPNGDFALKGDTWQELQFNFEIISKGDLAPIYADGAPYTIPS